MKNQNNIYERLFNDIEYCSDVSKKFKINLEIVEFIRNNIDSQIYMITQLIIQELDAALILRDIGET